LAAAVVSEPLGIELLDNGKYLIIYI